MSVVTATIFSNGKKVTSVYQLVALDISKEINRIPTARIILIDGTPSQQKFDLANSGNFTPGSEIEIKLRYESEPGKEASVFKGNVLKQLLSTDQEGFLLTVEVKHKAFNLTTTRKNSVFTEKNDDDIISGMLKAASLKSTGSMGTAYKHPQLVQYGCSDWDFIVSRVDANGSTLIVGDEEIRIQTIKDLEGKSKKRTLVFGINEIYGFECEADGSGQMAKVSGTGWDIKKQSMLPLKAAKTFDPECGNLSGSKLGQNMDADCLLVNSGSVDEKEIEAWANAKLVKSRMSLYRGRISVRGTADFQLGDMLELDGMGKLFAGKVLISGIRHQVDQQGWTTDVQFGLPAQWFSESNNIMDNPAQGLLPGVHGLQIGVIDKFEEDPDKNFRVKVNVPALKSQKEGIVWARLLSPYAGKEHGFFFFPEVGDEVLLDFIGGDPRQAIIIGSVYSSANTVPKDFKSSKENIDKGIVMKNGARISFKDDKKSIIELQTPEKNKITINDDKKSIVILDQNENQIEMNDKGIFIKSGKDITLEASGKIILNSKDITAGTGDGKIALKGSAVEVK
jgi:Rhs element Vgr protein